LRRVSRAVCHPDCLNREVGSCCAYGELDADAISEVSDEHVNAVLAGSCRISRAWTGLRAEYSWLPPYQGEALTKPNRVEIVFSAHDDVVIDQQAQAYAVRVQPGGMYVVGQHPTTLLRVGAYSDTLELYPALAGLSSGSSRCSMASPLARVHQGS
jgi:hypothetical protein